MNRSDTEASHGGILDSMPGGRILLSAWIALGAVFLVEAQEQASRPSVRFHHFHYQVAEPAAAMNAAARDLEGVRIVVPGLGVGVRVADEYLLFDRMQGQEALHSDQRPASAMFEDAVAWLSARGVATEPASFASLRVAAALPRAGYEHIAFSTSDLPAITRALVSAGAAVSRRSDDAVLFDAGAGAMVEIVRDVDRPETHWCPMHPDVRSFDAGACPICGMALVPIPPPRIGEYRLDVMQVRDRGRMTGLRLAVREPGTNAPVTKFAAVHEKVFHLFVVSRDLEYFAHVHPEPVADGSFMLKHALPRGEYMLIADFLPEAGTSQMVQKAIIVGGAAAARPRVDESNGLVVRLQAENLAAGKHARLSFTVLDARSGAPVTDLEPYLGAPAHMLLVRADLADAVHAHPEEITSSGPTVSFHPVIPSAGEYRLWVQFQRGGKVSTTTFALNVER